MTTTSSVNNFNLKIYENKLKPFLCQNRKYSKFSRKFNKINLMICPNL